eukprot:8231989-Pyramimonas_sp.AAC.1
MGTGRRARLTVHPSVTASLLDGGHPGEPPACWSGHPGGPRPVLPTGRCSKYTPSRLGGQGFGAYAPASHHVGC